MSWGLHAVFPVLAAGNVLLSKVPNHTIRRALECSMPVKHLEFLLIITLYRRASQFLPRHIISPRRYAVSNTVGVGCIMLNIQLQVLG